jgi:hypothetical protein
MLLPLFFQFPLKVKTSLKLQSNVWSMKPVKSQVTAELEEREVPDYTPEPY